MPANVNTLFSDRHNILEELKLADLVIGAVLIPGARAPRLVTEADLQVMKPARRHRRRLDRPGAALSRRAGRRRTPSPTYIVEGVVHYCVTNMPGAVGRTSTYALCNVTFPYALQIANEGLQAACAEIPGLSAAVNMHDGRGRQSGGRRHLRF